MSKSPPKVFCNSIGSYVRNDRGENCYGYVSVGHGPRSCGTCIHSKQRAITIHTDQADEEASRWGLDYYF